MPEYMEDKMPGRFQATMPEYMSDRMPEKRRGESNVQALDIVKLQSVGRILIR